VATYETTYGSGYAGDLRSDRRPQLSWSAIWGGTLLGWGALVLLSLVGALIGFATLDSIARESSANAGVGAYLWGALESIACAVLGGFATARLSGSRRRRDAAVHAAIGWALSMVAGALLALSVAGTAARSEPEMAARRPVAARADVASERGTRERGTSIGTATSAMGAGTAIASLVAALLGGAAGAVAAGRRRGDALRWEHSRAIAGQEDQPTILPPVH
jgi:hypothetical protein